MQVVERKGIKLNFKRSLVEVKPDKQEAIFQVLEEDRTETYPVSDHLYTTSFPVNFLSTTPLPQ